MKLKLKILSINEFGKTYLNLSRDERETLHSLINDDEIVTKSADTKPSQGSTIVVLSKKDYLMEASS